MSGALGRLQLGSVLGKMRVFNRAGSAGQVGQGGPQTVLVF